MYNVPVYAARRLRRGRQWTVWGIKGGPPPRASIGRLCREVSGRKEKRPRGRAFRDGFVSGMVSGRAL